MIQHLYYLVQRGNYVATKKHTERYLEQFNDILNDYEKGVKLDILVQLLNSLLKLNDKEELDYYLIEFKNILDKLPEDNFGYKITYKIHHTSLFLRSDLLQKSNAESIKFEHLLDLPKQHYYSMLIATTIVSPLVNFYLSKREYERSYFYIKQLSKGKGGSESTDDLILFMENYYLSLIISESIDWKDYNVSNFDGTQTKVALDYLEQAKMFLGKLNKSYSIASLLHEVVLKSRLDMLYELDENRINEQLNAEGYDYILVLMVQLLYYVGLNKTRIYFEIKEKLYDTIKLYIDFPIYQRLLSQIDSICSYYEMSETWDLRLAKEHFDNMAIQNYVKFLQNELNSSLAA